MGQKKIQIEAASRIEQSYSFKQVVAFCGIGSPLTSCREIKQEFRCSRCLSHLLLLLSNSRFRACDTRATARQSAGDSCINGAAKRLPRYLAYTLNGINGD